MVLLCFPSTSSWKNSYQVSLSSLGSLCHSLPHKQVFCMFCVWNGTIFHVVFILKAPETVIKSRLITPSLLRKLSRSMVLSSGTHFCQEATGKRLPFCEVWHPFVWLRAGVWSWPCFWDRGWGHPTSGPAVLRNDRPSPLNSCIVSSFHTDSLPMFLAVSSIHLLVIADRVKSEWKCRLLALWKKVFNVYVDAELCRGVSIL